MSQNLPKRYISTIGPINIQLNGQGRVFGEICKELEAQPGVYTDSQVDLEINLVPPEFLSSYGPTVFSAKENMNFNETSFYVGSPVGNLVTDLFTRDKKCTVDVASKPVTWLNQTLDIYKSVKGINPFQSSIMTYTLFWYVFHAVLLKKDCSFIHAGVVSYDGNATVIAGTGGAGKTSTLSKILEDERYQYLSEDFGVVGESGKVFYNPKFMSIYASDTWNNQAILINYLRRNLKGLRKLKWEVARTLLRRNCMTKASARDVLGSHRICDESRVERVIYMVRTDTEHFKESTISAEELADRLTYVAFRETKRLSETIRLIKANAPVGYKYPSETELLRDTKSVYQRAFSQADRKLVLVPHKAVPDRVVGYLKQQKFI